MCCQYVSKAPQIRFYLNSGAIFRHTLATTSPHDLSSMASGFIGPPQTARNCRLRVSRGHCVPVYLMSNTLTTYAITASGGLTAVAGSPRTLPGAEPLIGETSVAAPVNTFIERTSRSFFVGGGKQGATRELRL